MAVTINRAELAVELRIATTTAEDLPEGQGAVLDRLLSTASALVTNYAPNAPDAIHNEALVRVAGWLYDTDPAEARRATSPVQHSGASSLLAPYRVRRLAGLADTSAPAVPVVIDTTDGISEAEIRALIAGGIASHAADANAHHVPPAPGGVQRRTHRRPNRTALIAPWAQADFPTGQIPPMRVGENPAADTVPVVATGGRAFRFLEISSFSGDAEGLTQVQVDARVRAGVADWAEHGNTDPDTGRQADERAGRRSGRGSRLGAYR